MNSIVGGLVPWPTAMAMLTAVLVCAGAGVGEGLCQNDRDIDSIQVASQRRFVKLFDFDERKRGNLEDVPMLWFRKEAKGFPTHARGGFDERQGHLASPSFLLEPNGGSIAFDYLGKEVPVLPNSDYEATAWVRTAGMENARASVRAFLLNRGGERIPGSERQSDLICGTREGNGWRQVRILVPGAFPEARFLGLTVSVEQPQIWRHGPRPAGYIDRTDIRAAAWFDDIEIYRLPRVLLTTETPEQVFQPDRIASLVVQVSDSADAQIEAGLAIRSAAGETVLRKPIEISPLSRTQPEHVPLGNLPSGLYVAELEVRSADHELARRTLQFARLAQRARAKSRLMKTFGIVLSPAPWPDWTNQYHMALAVGTGHVKLPLRGLGGKDAAVCPWDGQINDLVQALARSRVNITGILSEAAAVGVEQQRRQPLVDLINGDPQAWRPCFDVTMSHYATLIPKWQIGPDQEQDQFWTKPVKPMVSALRKQMSVNVPQPCLAVPWSIQYTMPGAPGTEFLSLAIPPTLPPTAILRHFAEMKKQQPKGLWAVVSALPETGYHRVGRLGDLAKRLVYCAAGGAETVFIAQPWNTAAGTEKPRVEPTEDLLVFRTVADALDRTALLSRIDLDPEVECLLFDAGGEAVLALWDDGAEGGPRTHTLPLGNGLEQVSLWGERTPLPSDGDHSTIRLSPTPVFVLGAQSWLAHTVASVRFTPNKLETTFRAHRHRIEFFNSAAEAISGRFTLLPPPEWNISPPTVPFALEPNQTFLQEVTLQFPHSQPAGRQIVTMDMQLNADRRYNLRIPLRLELGLDQIRVWSLTQVDESTDQVIIRQQITNQSSRPVALQGFVIAPDRPTRRQILPHVPPKETVTREYVLSGAKSLRGQRVRIGLHDREGSRVYNEEVLVP